MLHHPPSSPTLPLHQTTSSLPATLLRSHNFYFSFVYLFVNFSLYIYRPLCNCNLIQSNTENHSTIPFLSIIFSLSFSTWYQSSKKKKFPFRFINLLKTPSSVCFNFHISLGNYTHKHISFSFVSSFSQSFFQSIIDPSSVFSSTTHIASCIFLFSVFHHTEHF